MFSIDCKEACFNIEYTVCIEIDSRPLCTCSFDQGMFLGEGEGEGWKMDREGRGTGEGREGSGEFLQLLREIEGPGFDNTKRCNYSFFKVLHSVLSS